MTINKLISVSLLTAMAMVATTNAQTIENVTPQQLIINADTVFTETPATVENELLETFETDEGAISSIIVEEAKVRRAPNPDADIIHYIKEGIPVFVVERIDNWYHIEIEGIDGYIYKDQVDESSLSMIPYTKTVKEEEVKEEKKETYLGEEVISYAKQFLGNPYVYGGNSLTKGVDCSGFVQQVFKNFGIKVTRSSRSQFASDGYKVSKKELLPGDLVFYGYNGNIDHVAIYAGGDQIIHSSTPETGITMDSLYFGKPMIGIKRVIK